MTSASGNRFCPLMLKVERKYVEYVNIYISFPFCHEILIHVTRFVYSRQRIKPEVCTRSLAIRNHHPDEVSCHKKESRIFAILNVPFFFFFFFSLFFVPLFHSFVVTIRRQQPSEISFSVNYRATHQVLRKSIGYRVLEISRRLIKITITVCDFTEFLRRINDTKLDLNTVRYAKPSCVVRNC